MTSTKTTARTMGLLLLLHLGVGLMLPFIMLQRVTGSRGFLLAAAENAVQVRMVVLLLTVGSAISIGVAIKGSGVIRRYSPAMSLWLLALAVAAFSLQVVDTGRILSMLSLSQAYASGGAERAELFQALAVVVGSARKWAHYTYLLVAVSWILLLFVTLFRFRLVPRWLAWMGMIASALQIGGVTLRSIMGYAPETRLAMPLAPAYVALALWLMFKGFDEGQPSVTEANRAMVEVV